jgi:hypothetical protein
VKSEKIKANEAFIAKIKTLAIKTGKKLGKPVKLTCSECGETVEGYVVAAGRIEMKKVTPPVDEQAFCE